MTLIKVSVGRRGGLKKNNNNKNNTAFLNYLHNINLMISFVMYSNKMDQVVQAYFEIWTIEVSTGVKNNLSVDFKIFFYHLHVISG